MGDNNDGLGSTRYRRQRSLSRVMTDEDKAFLKANPHMWSKPELVDNHIDDVWKHYVGKEKYMQKKQLTLLAKDSIEQFIMEYQQKLIRDHPNDINDPVEMQKHLDMDLPVKQKHILICFIVEIFFQFFFVLFSYLHLYSICYLVKLLVNV
jgi:hypothetical protein